MNKIKVIKKFKANFIRLKLHKLIGFIADYLLYLGYLLKLSRWIDLNKTKFRHNDFYNARVNQQDRLQLYSVFASECELNKSAISYLEFGVARGNSLRWWVENNNNPQSLFWAFDTYEGLPEKYGTYEKGTFNQDGNFPDIPDNRINFIKGLFQDTLLDTIPQIDFEKRTIIHIDGDLYSSALYTLSMLYPYLKKGDFILFDEFGVPLHEFRAFNDFVRSFYIKLEPVGAINNYLQVVFEIKEIKNGTAQ
ncbi:TylF/MycF/NovP-related O-methyltransferase [Ekhidna sp.]|uniref:TylF/MycF/NovP-related O-methyltransferase n=1 Tax=Ekhidna sp. TaxID=2608089 RepID=UPI00329A4438